MPLTGAQGEEEPSPAEVQQPAEDYAPEDTGYLAVPRTFTLPAGTVITVRTLQHLSSDQNRPGDGFSAELHQPLVVDGWVVARRGQTALGRVVVAQKAGRVKGVSELGVELSALVLVDGQQVPVRTQLMQTASGTSHGADATAVGTAAGIGAIIGAAAEGGGKGAGIGAAAGAGAGLAGVLLTRGRQTVIPPETLLTFQLEYPITISTERSRVAFRPVQPEDYEARAELRRRTERFAVAPPPPPYYWRGYYPWGGYYPAPYFVGFYHFGGHRHHRRW
jgi:hypothetical protein